MFLPLAIVERGGLAIARSPAPCYPRRIIETLLPAAPEREERVPAPKLLAQLAMLQRRMPPATRRVQFCKPVSASWKRRGA